MNISLLKKWFRELETVGADHGGGVTRLAYSPEEDAMFLKIAGFAAEMGLNVSEDCIGNMYISFPGREGTPCHGIGSHLDSVPQGGLYDGPAGVLAGLLVMEEIRSSGLDLPVMTAVFRAEESSLYGLATAGSGVAAGSVDIAQLKNALSISGDSLYDAMSSKGYYPGVCGLEKMLDFTELHIEQGRVLWESGLHIGIVTAIAAPTRLKVTIHGRQDHSGATPMDLRKDGLCAAADIILAVESAGNAEKHHATVATVGVANVRPNALNVVPGLVELRIDIRGILKDSISRTVKAVKDSVRAASDTRGILCDVETISSMDPVSLDPSVIRSLSRAAEELSVPFRQMASGAGHDTMKIAPLVPAGMVFIPCKEGISHNQQEEADLEDIALGARVILDGIRLRRSNNTSDDCSK